MTKPKGFAALSPEERRAIGSRGGKRVHALGKAYLFTSEDAQEAGRKGGRSLANRPGYMAEIGRKGGQARKKKVDPEPDIPLSDEQKKGAA